MTVLFSTRRFSQLLPATVLLTCTLQATFPAEGRESLLAAITRIDKKHIEINRDESLGTSRDPRIDTMQETGEPPRPQSIRKGTVEARLDYTPKSSTDVDSYTTTVTIYESGVAVATLTTDTSLISGVGVQISELDVNNPYPEVVVSHDTGGAHCCSDTTIVTSFPDGSAWTTVSMGQLDGGLMFPTDLDGDGKYEFSMRDNAFLYLFAPYVYSGGPLKIYALEGLEMKNITREARYRRVHAAFLSGYISNLEEEQQEINGFLAGYVAQKILLGEGRQAWELMKAYYDPKSEMGLDYCSTLTPQIEGCNGIPVKLNFPSALRRFLEKEGYAMD